MKIGGMPDLHLRASPPANRTDNYYTTQFLKLKYCFDYFVKADVGAICLPGDVFNNYGRDPYYLTKDFLDFLCGYESSWCVRPDEIPFYIFMVFGQHDLRFHDLENFNTPAQILLASRKVRLLGAEPMVFADVSFQGASWGEEIPKPYEGEAFKVLVCHKMIILEEKIWAGQRDYSRAQNFLKSSGYNLIISGDNHQQIIVDDGDSGYLFNSGSLCRMCIDQGDLQPNFTIFDTNNRTWENPLIPVEDFNKIMDMTSITPTEVEGGEEYLKSFVKGLKDKLGDKKKPDFRKTLILLSEEADPHVKKIIERTIECLDQRKTSPRF